MRDARCFAEAEAGDLDAPDGLSKRFRIKAHFPAVSPGAVDEAAIDLMFEDGKTSCDAIYRLRFHSPRQFYDFKFRMAIEYKAQSEAEAKLTAAEKEESTKDDQTGAD